MKITFYPGVDKTDLNSGVLSEISWQRLLPYLEEVFYVNDNEKIIGITVSEYGIKAKFETNNEAKNLRAIPKQLKT